MNLDLLPQFLFNGLMSGMIYLLIAFGISLIFGMMDFINFAHGTFYALGAYLAWTITTYLGNFWLALLVVPLAVALLAMIVETTLLRRLHGLHHTVQLLLTFGVAVMMQELIIIIWGPIGKPVSVPPILAGQVNLGFTAYPVYRVCLVAFVALVAFALWWGIEKTKVGSLIRAGTERAEMVNALGINVSRLFTAVFTLGGFLAGLAGVLAAPLVGINAYMGLDIIVIAFVVVVVGGMGSFAGAIVGGLLIGVVQSLTGLYWPEATDMMVFIVMAVVLIARPQGLLGRA
jgi:branched-chain amino acid transport system permease protein